MTIESTLKSVLAATGYPVYAIVVPEEGDYPCYAYQRISTPQERTHAGNAFERARMQVSCWGNTYAEAVTLAEAAKIALDLNQIKFELATKENEFDLKEKGVELYQKVLDFFVWD